MAVEDQIVAALRADPAVSALVGARIYDMPAPQGAESPYITYQFTGVSRVGRIYNGRTAHDLTGLQVDCWADKTASTTPSSRAAQVRALARAVRAALDRTGLTGEDTVDLITWDSWVDLSTPDETRRSLDFTLSVKDP